MEKFIALILLSLFLGCQSLSNKKNDMASVGSLNRMPELEGTQWQCKIADDCIDYYLFKADSNFIYYSGETNDKYYGKYYVKDDTLYTHEFAADTDSILSSTDCEHQSEQAKYKIVLESGKLKHVERWSYSVTKNLWTKDNFDFEDDFLFEKVK